MSAAIRLLHRAEDWLLVLVLLAMIVLAGMDILARSLFGGGVVWIPPLLRVMVLWLGLLGALLATRSREHISIDLAGRLAGPRLKSALGIVTSVFAAAVCLIIAWYSHNFVRFAWEFGDVAFGNVPAWPLQIIIPFTFGLMGLRFLLQTAQDLNTARRGESL